MCTVADGGIAPSEENRHPSRGGPAGLASGNGVPSENGVRIALVYLSTGRQKKTTIFRFDQRVSSTDVHGTGFYTRDGTRSVRPTGAFAEQGRIAADETVRVWRPGASFAMSIRSCYFGRGDRRCFSGIPRISVISVNRTFVRSTTGETGNRARGTKRTRVVSSSLAECVVSFKAGFTKRS